MTPYRFICFILVFLLSILSLLAVPAICLEWYIRRFTNIGLVTLLTEELRYLILEKPVYLFSHLVRDNE